MNTKKLLLIGGGALAVATVFAVLYKKNIKKIEKEEEKVKKDFQDLGIDITKLDEETVKVVKDNPDYGDVHRFADLPIPQQVSRLLRSSDKWLPEDLDWETAVYSDNGAYNSVHVVFKEGTSDEGFPNNKVGFFIEVPPLYNGDYICTLKYKNYVEYLNRLSQDFWARNRVTCSRPEHVDIIGLYSKQVTIKGADGNEAKILQYEKIPTEVLKGRSKYNDRLDGLYSYYSDAKREREENNIEIIPEDKDDIHIFMGVWFKVECRDTDTYGIKLEQILQFLEEVVIEDNFVIEDYNHKNRQKLSPVIIHPGAELEYILDENLRIQPIEFN